MTASITRRTLAVPLRWASHWSGMALKQARAIKRPRILMYHIIGGDEVSRQQFDWQLRFLREQFEPIGLSELVDRIQAATTTGREVAITFDDGVQNHYTTAWPLLRTYAIPATFFVCPGLIESGKWLWRTELRMRLQMLGEAERSGMAKEAGCPEHAVDPIMQWTKKLPLDARLAFQRGVEQRTAAFAPSQEQRACHAPLTWEQLRQLDTQLVTIGSHTSTHPMLPTLAGPMLERELAGSRALLEEKLDRTVDLFCYPNGANSAMVVDMARGHYRAAVTTEKAIVAGNSDMLRLPRIPAGGTRAEFVRRLHKPTA